MKILQNNRGSSLIGTLFLVLIMGMAGGAAVNMSPGERANSLNELQATQAFYVSQAGLEIAKKMAAEGINPDGTTMDFGMGSFVVAYDGASATSTANVGNAVKTQTVAAALAAEEAVASCGATTDGSGQLFATGGTVKVMIGSGTSAASQTFKQFSSSVTVIGTNTDVGQIVDLGTFPAGQELIFGITTGSGNTYMTGPANRNPDMRVHARVINYNEELVVEFEDQLGGGDNDYNDASIHLLCTDPMAPSEVYLAINGGTVTGPLTQHPFNITAGVPVMLRSTSDISTDLFVRMNAPATTAIFDARSAVIVGGTKAVIYTPSVSGIMYVAVRASGSGVIYDLTAHRTNQQVASASSHLNVSDSVLLNQMKYYTLDVTAGQNVSVKTFSSQDVDLYIKMGSNPTTASYELRGYTSSGNETIIYTASSTGTLYIGVHGYQAGSFTLVTADSAVGAPPPPPPCVGFCF